MHLSNTLPLASALLLSVAPLATADDFDAEDVPRSCVSVCRPIRDLVRQCNVDDDAVGGDRNEDLLERQCICENNSFDVADVAGQCQGCIEEHFEEGCGDNENDDDDDDDDDIDDCDGREDIRDLMRACGFSSVSYDSASATSSISVSASPFTDISQLTTTVNPQETGNLGVGDATNDDNNDDNGNQNNENRNNNDDDSGAMQGALPGMALYVAGAAVAGAAMLL
jgi:hypothetical protein